MESFKTPHIGEKDKDFSKFFHSVIDSGCWAKLSFKAKAVYMVLSRFAGYETRRAFPTIIKISQLSGVSKDGVSEALNELEQNGLIEKKRGGPKIGFRNIYKVFKSPERRPVIFKNLLVKKNKIRTQRDSVSGKFYSQKGKDISREITVKCSDKKEEMSSQSEKTVKGTRENTVPGTSRENTDDKQIREIKSNRDSGLAESLAWPKSQASTRLSKSLNEANKETLNDLLKQVGEEGFRKLLVKSGYEQGEIDLFIKTNSLVNA